MTAGTSEHITLEASNVKPQSCTITAPGWLGSRPARTPTTVWTVAPTASGAASLLDGAAWTPATRRSCAATRSWSTTCPRSRPDISGVVPVDVGDSVEVSYDSTFTPKIDVDVQPLRHARDAVARRPEHAAPAGQGRRRRTPRRAASASPCTGSTAAIRSSSASRSPSWPRSWRSTPCRWRSARRRSFRCTRSRWPRTTAPGSRTIPTSCASARRGPQARAGCRTRRTISPTAAWRIRRSPRARIASTGSRRRACRRRSSPSRRTATTPIPELIYDAHRGCLGVVFRQVYQDEHHQRHQHAATGRRSARRASCSPRRTTTPSRRRVSPGPDGFNRIWYVSAGPPGARSQTNVREDARPRPAARAALDSIEFGAEVTDRSRPARLRDLAPEGPLRRRRSSGTSRCTRRSRSRPASATA